MSRRALNFIVSVFKRVKDWSGIGNEQEAINRSEPPTSLFWKDFGTNLNLGLKKKKNCVFWPFNDV